MNAVGIVDTSVLLELLRVPGTFSRSDEVVREMVDRHASGHSLLLPIAAIIETGNHIGRLQDGNHRRRFAAALVNVVQASLEGKAPFIPLDDVGVEDVRAWCAKFVSWVTPPGQTMADLSIKHAWELQCELHQGRRVYIWSLDDDLSSFDRPPRI